MFKAFHINLHEVYRADVVRPEPGITIDQGQLSDRGIAVAHGMRVEGANALVVAGGCEEGQARILLSQPHRVNLYVADPVEPDVMFQTRAHVDERFEGMHLLRMA